MKIARGLIILFLWGVAFALQADESQETILSPQASIRLTENQGGFVDVSQAGQLHRLSLSIDIPGWLSRAPKYPELVVEGAIVLPPRSFGVNEVVEIDGETWTRQTQEYLLFPKRAGAFIVPPLALDIRYRNFDGVTQNFRVQTDYFGFETIVSVAPVISRRAELNEQISATHIAPGEVVTRVIRLSAEDQLGMLLPEFLSSGHWLSEQSIPGGKIYRRYDPQLDRYHRGQLEGTRQETWSYVFHRPGTYQLQAISLDWYQPEQDLLNQLTLEPITITVQGAESPLGGDGVPQPFDYLGLAVKLSFMLLVLAALLGVFKRGAAAELPAAQRQGPEWEAACFAGLCQLLEGKAEIDLEALLAKLYAWHQIWRYTYLKSEHSDELVCDKEVMWPKSWQALLTAYYSGQVDHLDLNLNRRLLLRSIQAFRIEGISHCQKKSVRSNLLPRLYPEQESRA